MEVCKTAGWYKDVCSLKADMAVNLTSLTRQAGAGPGCNISTHVRPTKTTTDQAAGGTNTMMADAVKMEKDLLSESGRHKRAENARERSPRISTPSTTWETTLRLGNNFRNKFFLLNKVHR